MSEESQVRLDKWLWAARFFKTRALASQAVAGGKVQVGGLRVKPSRLLAVGDAVRIQKDQDEFAIVVRALSSQRRGAPEAQLLYEETPESIAARAQAREAQRLLRVVGAAPPGRPGKRDRRLIRRFIKKEQ
ncbi:RNA-binding S4 domain-containing protein [Thiovibrio frasassiensis]|jgi:ribosome-associated heat shock protein Hsp15|uniref:S4 domain-containing protein n=1 Tax=Thiovibrio frasassiensis TaxID=2984131 RepID=A0A9X4MJZ2_9BACT|nr:S4 domain-containing protein [Thiovibrio frasassiensis]MDG4476923.1 S4 domain-containing protein [Thiovibrio frasassiensis]